MKSVQVGHIAIYVYDEQGAQHDRAHCEVRWSGNRANFTIDGDEPTLLNRSRGARITKEVKDAVIASYIQIRADWNRLNPGRRV